MADNAVLAFFILAIIVNLTKVAILAVFSPAKIANLAN